MIDRASRGWEPPLLGYPGPISGHSWASWASLWPDSWSFLGFLGFLSPIPGHSWASWAFWARFLLKVVIPGFSWTRFLLKVVIPGLPGGSSDVKVVIPGLPGPDSGQSGHSWASLGLILDKGDDSGAKVVISGVKVSILAIKVTKVVIYAPTSPRERDSWPAGGIPACK